MGVFDKVMALKPDRADFLGEEKTKNNSSQVIGEDTELFSEIDKRYNKKTPLGYFFNTLHKNGYAILERSAETNEIVPTELANALLTEGNQIINAIAGSGKTTSLSFRVMKDILTGEATVPVNVNGNTVLNVDKILVSTFSNSGAEELKKTIADFQRKFGYIVTVERMSFKTLHAEFLSALRDMGVPINIGTPEAITSCLTKAVNAMGITSRDNSRLTFDDYSAIASIVAFYRNHITDKKYTHPACDDYYLTPPILDMLVLNFAEERKAAGIHDFEDLQELLYKFLYVKPNPAVIEKIASRYRYVYIDEFQDTSEIQYAIIRAYCRGRLVANITGEKGELEDGLYTGKEEKGKLVVVGDDDQSIYSWRGSALHVMLEDVEKDFKPNVSYLSKNYRCPANILNPVVSSISKNIHRVNKNIIASKEGGDFKAVGFKSTRDMIGCLIDDISTDINEGRDVAILCRTNFDAVIPALMLEMNGNFKFSLSSKDMTLKGALPRSILSVAKLFTETSSPAVKTALTTLCSFKVKHEATTLYEKLKADSAINRRTSIWTLHPVDIDYSCPSLYPLIMRMKEQMFDANGNKIPKGDISALKLAYWTLSSEIFTGTTAYSIKARAYIDALLYMLDSRNYDCVAEFLDEIFELQQKLDARVFKKERNKVYTNSSQIKFVTVHEFKGKESDSVYIWHASEKYFPAPKVDIEDEMQMEEERRIFYIANTRARKKHRIYTMLGNECIFLKEMDCAVERFGSTNTISLTNHMKLNSGNPSSTITAEEEKLRQNLAALGVSSSEELADRGFASI